MKKPTLSSTYRDADGRMRPGPGRYLSPVLLDRLTDDHVQQSSEPDGTFLLTRTSLRESVLRDLRWLLNTTNLESTDDLSGQPYVQRSVLNYGISALAGKRMSEIEWVDIENTMREAIVSFEPRIEAETLQMRCIADSIELDEFNLLAIEVRGRIIATPYPIEFVFRSEIDMENGYVVLRSTRSE